MPKCRLCKKESDLCVSHIIPAFVYKWIKDTSATGYLRMGGNPNVPMQDGLKIPLLCKDCESKFSKWEKIFREKIFIPYHDTNRGLEEFSFEYEEWLLKFVISVNWRNLVIQYDPKSEHFSEKQKKEIELCEEQWRKYLNEEQESSGESRHHIFFFGPISIENNPAAAELTHKKINTYILRSADLDIAHNSKTVFAFTKMAKILLISFILPSDSKLMTGTKIHRKGRITTSSADIKDPLIGQYFLIIRPQEVFDKNPPVSELQQKKIDEKAMKNIERLLNSESAAASFLDRKIQISKRSTQ